MVAGFPHVQTDENVYVLLIQDHRHTAPLFPRSVSYWLVNGGRSRHPRYEGPVVVPLSAISCRQAGPGDNTPRIMKRLGAETMPGPTGQHTLILQQERATKKVTG
ncbi:hypothetical protein, partial [Pseudarthrobacter enclensis]|uniref:hypothetical protein n=1 Tax=Pseudarthrobacter enclensis TaxID=993070 RepID=UPI0027D88A20